MKPLLCSLALLIACGPTGRPKETGDDDATPVDAPSVCARECSADLHAVVDCHGNVIQDCTGSLACDPVTYTCQDACVAAESNHRSVGCDYYATEMQTQTYTVTYCFAAFIANTWTSPAHITVEYKGATLDTAAFARIPSGSGQSLSYMPYDATQGIAAGRGRDSVPRRRRG